MSYRGRGGGSRGRGGPRGGFRGGGRGRGGGGGSFNAGPPEKVVEVGTVLHSCQNDLVCKGCISKIPYFNAPIYLQNKSQVGKIDEIFGPVNEFHFSVKLNDGVLATSFDGGHKFYIDPFKLLPLERFLPKPKGAGGRVEKPRGGARGGRGRGTPRGRGGSGFRGRGGGGFRGRGGGGRGRGRGRF